MKGGYLHLVASALFLRTGLATVLPHKCDIPLLVEGGPHSVQQPLASAVSGLAISASLHCHPGRHT